MQDGTDRCPDAASAARVDGHRAGRHDHIPDTANPPRIDGQMSMNLSTIELPSTQGAHAPRGSNPWNLGIQFLACIHPIIPTHSNTGWQK
jgi:hypothetical protein